MDNELKEFIDLWEEKNNVGTLEDRLKRNEAWNVFFSTMAKGRKGPFTIEEKEAIEFIRLMGHLDDVESILDIGCGTGRYTLPLSKYAKRVLGVDMSDDSLEILNRDRDIQNITNIETRSSMWEMFDTDEKFDLSFSAMCPAICSYKDVDKLESYSKKYCAIVTAAKGTYSTNRRTITKIVCPDGVKNAVHNDAAYIINYLYLQDKKPCVKILSNERIEKRESEKEIIQLQQHLAIYGLVGKEYDEKVREYVMDRSVDGMIEDKRILNRAVITWKVK